MVCLMKVFGLSWCMYVCVFVLVVLNRIFTRFSSDLLYNLQAFKLMAKVKPDILIHIHIHMHARVNLLLYIYFMIVMDCNLFGIRYFLNIFSISLELSSEHKNQ